MEKIGTDESNSQMISHIKVYNKYFIYLINCKSRVQKIIVVNIFLVAILNTYCILKCNRNDILRSENRDTKRIDII